MCCSGFRSFRIWVALHTTVLMGAQQSSSFPPELKYSAPHIAQPEILNSSWPGAGVLLLFVCLLCSGFQIQSFPGAKLGKKASPTHTGKEKPVLHSPSRSSSSTFISGRFGRGGI